MFLPDAAHHDQGPTKPEVSSFRGSFGPSHLRRTALENIGPDAADSVVTRMTRDDLG